MISLIRKFTVPLSAIFSVVFLVIIALILMTKVSFADNGSADQDGRLITIHDRGTEKVIVSQAMTIGDALKEADISIDAKDSVEPAVSEKLVASDYQVNIYRARPVVVVDGNTKTKVMTPYQTAAQIAENAGIKLYVEDKTTLKQTDNIIAEGAGLQLIIDRATPFSFDLYGDVKTVRTQAATIGDMLNEKSIKLGNDDRLSLNQNTPISNGMSVRLWREGKQTVTSEVTIEFETEKIQDGDRETGYKEVRTAGEKGTRTVTYEVLIQNGKEVSRTEIASLTTKEPKKQVEIIGIKVVLPPGSHTDWMAAAGISASDYGYVEYIVMREGGWCPVRWQGDAGCINHGSAPSRGGYGLVQATPGNKMASAGSDWLTNPITQLKWANGYAVGRYGSWAAAYQHWLTSHNW